MLLTLDSPLQVYQAKISQADQIDDFLYGSTSKKMCINLSQKVACNKANMMNPKFQSLNSGVGICIMTFNSKFFFELTENLEIVFNDIAQILKTPDYKVQINTQTNFCLDTSDSVYLEVEKNILKQTSSYVFDSSDATVFACNFGEVYNRKVVQLSGKIKPDFATNEDAIFLLNNFVKIIDPNTLEEIKHLE